LRAYGNRLVYDVIEPGLSVGDRPEVS